MDKEKILNENETLGIVAARALIKLAGEDAAREGLARTPERFSKAYDHLFKGYREDLKSVVGQGIFRSESQLPISVNNIDFYSLCEHHILPFWGRVDVVYIPDNKILGLSKIPRIVDVFARRLQVQERLTKEIANGIQEVINAKYVLVRISSSHMCMKMRGVQKENSYAKTEYEIGLENISENLHSKCIKLIESD